MRSVQNTPMRVSVIIPTKNRSADLDRTIDTLLIQTVMPFELVLVDQSANPSFTRDIPIPLRYMHDPLLSGLTAARNLAITQAEGDILLFLDDDVLLEPNFIEEILNAYEDGITGVSGIITNYSVPALRQRLWERTFQRGPFRDERQSIYRNVERYTAFRYVQVRFLGGGLMSFRAAAIREHYFDTNLTGPCPGEDIDFCAGLPKGSVLLIAPRARLVHNRSPESRKDTHWLSVQSQVAYYMRERHWRAGLWNNLCFLWLKVGYLALAVYSMLGTRSTEAWRAWRKGAKTGKKLGASKAVD